MSLAPPRLSPWQLRAVDEMHDAYADWREETAGVRSTYERWSEAAAADQAWASTAYVAALDREEAAAERYACLVARVADLGEARPDCSPRCRESSAPASPTRGPGQRDP